MSVARLVELRGGLCARSDLVERTSRRAVERAVARGEVVVLGHGRLGLPAYDEAVAVAYGLRGVLCLTSAALCHGWEVKVVPERPYVAVGRGRAVTPQQRGSAHVSFPVLHADDVTDGRHTSVECTLDQCLRLLPPDEALAVADSALRHGVPPATLRRVARSARGPGAPQARDIAARADGRSANPFESVLRHLAHQVDGLSVEPQRVILGTRQTARPDLVDVDLQLVLEADSFEWHGSRAALRKDARRYNHLVADGWLVLRFAWEEVMFDPGYVIDVLREVTRTRTRSRRCPLCRA